MNKIVGSALVVVAFGSLCGLTASAIQQGNEVKEQSHAIEKVQDKVKVIDNDINSIKIENEKAQKQLDSLKKDQDKQAKEVKERLK